jgi:hypothetical protein
MVARGVKVLCFDTLLEVFIPRELLSASDCKIAHGRPGSGRGVLFPKEVRRSPTVRAHFLAQSGKVLKTRQFKGEFSGKDSIDGAYFSTGISIP